MDEHFASLALTNSTVLCVGGITHAETEATCADGAPVDGFGYYLFLAQEDSLNEPVQVLAKFLSADHAEKITRLFNRSAAELTT